MKLIKLTQGKFAQVDDEDYDYLNQFKWCARQCKTSLEYYAFRNGYNSKNKKILIGMHRDILGIIESNLKGDHIDHNPLNNQRSNLRIATNSQNMANRLSKKNSSSKYLGVTKRTSKCKGIVRWLSSCTKNGKLYAKIYKTEKEAALGYNDLAKVHHGEFANLNKI